MKLSSRFKYDICAFLQVADETLLKNHTYQAQSLLGLVTEELKIVTSRTKVPEASELLAILQKADKALLEKKPAVAHSAMRLAITELTGDKNGY